jgi:hypothetical protein
MAKLLGGLFYLTVWIAEIGQFVAVVGIAILATAVIVWGCVGSDRWRLQDAIRVTAAIALVLILLGAIAIYVLSARSMS